MFHLKHDCWFICWSPWPNPADWSGDLLAARLNISLAKHSSSCPFHFHHSVNSSGLWRRLKSNSRGWRRGGRPCGGGEANLKPAVAPAPQPALHGGISPPQEDGPQTKKRKGKSEKDQHA